MKFMPPTAYVVFIYSLLLLPAAADAPSPFHPFPGELDGTTGAHWLAPYVFYADCWFPENRQETVRWYDDRGHLMKEISGSVRDSHGYVSESTRDELIVHGMSGLWKVTFRPNPAYRPPGKYPPGVLSPDDYYYATGDVFARQFHISDEQTKVEVYSKGKLVGSHGPFLDHKTDHAKLNEDGCTSLVTWKDDQRKTEEVLVIGPDAQIRLRMDIPKGVNIKEGRELFTYSEGKGVLLQLPEEQPKRRYLAVNAGGGSQIFDLPEMAYPRADIPASDLVLFLASDNDKLLLVHAATGAVVWDVPVAVRHMPTIEVNVLVAEDKILVVGLDVAALDLKTGKVVATWKSQWKPELDSLPRAFFTRQGGDIYIVGERQFFRLNLRDIDLKVHGWE